MVFGQFVVRTVIFGQFVVGAVIFGQFSLLFLRQLAAVSTRQRTEKKKLKKILKSDSTTFFFSLVAINLNIYIYIFFLIIGIISYYFKFNKYYLSILLPIVQLKRTAAGIRKSFVQCFLISGVPSDSPTPLPVKILSPPP